MKDVELFSFSFSIMHSLYFVARGFQPVNADQRAYILSATVFLQLGATLFIKYIQSTHLISTERVKKYFFCQGDVLVLVS